jgi:hypothetical protein
MSTQVTAAVVFPVDMASANYDLLIIRLFYGSVFLFHTTVTCWYEASMAWTCAFAGLALGISKEAFGQND